MPTQKIIIERLLVLTLVIAATSTAAADVSIQVYDVDGVTPFDCNGDTMVGSRLTLVVSSDSNDSWSGGLFIEGQDRALGTLAGRGLDPNDPNARDYTDSHLENAGDLAKVTAWMDSSMWGFDLYTYRPFYPFDNNMVDNSTFPGDWFVIDYYADEVGECNVGFYDYDISWADPNYYIVFLNVPTRDLNSDEIVDFRDFAIFASQWNATGCSDPNWCKGADIDRDGDVDPNDLGLFVEYWLWPTAPDSPNEPGDSNHPQDPNITYSIVDANGLSEITLDVNETITLYVDIATVNDVNVKGVWFFHVEVDISDTNLGSIDNTECPNGTAQILAEPNRDSAWDDWGPGIEQEDGILFFGMTDGCPIADGHLASFVFTSTKKGDVTLNLISHCSGNTDDELVFPKLEPIHIHQTEPD